MVYNEQFIAYGNRSAFDADLAKGKIKETSIVFIEDTKQIWTQGTLYSCSFTEDEKIKLDKLDTWSVTVATKKELADKADIDDLSNIVGEEIIGGPVLEEVENLTREELKKDLFIDMWTQCYDCQYDATKGAKPFTCNGLDLSYEDAIKVYNAPRLTYNSVAGFVNLTRNVRTIILGSYSSGGTLPSFANAFRTSSLEVIRVSSDTSTAYVDDAPYAFYGCSSLKRILGTMSFTYGKGDTTNAFKGCVKLTDVSIHALKQNIAFSDSPLLSLSSLQFLVTNAINTNNITVTVHPDAYARITDELFAQAAEKQINFATTT